MIQFGVSTFVWVSPFLSTSFDLLYKVADMGYDIIEVAVEDKDLIDWPRLKKLAAETGLKLTISGAFGASRKSPAKMLLSEETGSTTSSTAFALPKRWRAQSLRGRFTQRWEKPDWYPTSEN